MTDSASTSTSNVEEIGRIVAGAERIGLITHRRPDGDAIGSTVAMAEVLRVLGKFVIPLIEDGVPDSLRFLPATDCIQTLADLPEPAAVDVVIALDCADRERAGDAVWEALTGYETVINIDHHVSNSEFGDINHVDVNSPATGQILFEIFEELGWPLTEAARDNLFAAISTDTGAFRYPSTTAETYRIGARLVERGLDVGMVSQKLYENYPARRIFLLRELLDTMELHFDQRAVCLKLTHEMVARLKIEPGDTEGLVDIVRAIDTVIVAVFFEELPDGTIRVSVRSKSEAADVGLICAGFGGGGHRLAAGARMEGPIDSAAEKFLAAVKEKFDGKH